MDMLRSCYSTTMKMTHGTDPHYKVKWYFCPDTATPLPGGYHLFGSDIWHLEGLAGLGLGEGWNAVRSYSKGAIPAPVTGLDLPCGDPDWFVEGVPNGTPSLLPTSQGLPKCCFAEPPCQPFFTTNRPGRVIFNVTTAQTYPFVTNGFNAFEGRDPSHAGIFVFANTSGVPCSPAPFTAVVDLADLRVGGFRVHMHLVSYDAPTFIGTWTAPTAPGPYNTWTFHVKIPP